MITWCRSSTAIVASFATLIFTAPASGRSCEQLAKLVTPGVTINSATEVAAGKFAPAGAQTSLDVPAFCRVTATARPTSDSEINFEVWLPEARLWNGDFEGVGNGGYVGAIHYSDMAEALKRGFATSGSDTGHTDSDLKFGYGHPEKIVDWGYRSVHVMTESAKILIRAFAGALPRHSYFDGCSTGGHQALSEVQRFPADYDGVIAGDPGNNRVHLNVGFLWAFSATHDNRGNAILPSAKLPLINEAALRACDAADGVKDGILSDPLNCRFDPSVLLCRGPESDGCLTPAQVAAVKKVYAGPRNPRSGEQIIAGYTPGSESPAGDALVGGWKTYITDPKQPARVDFWRYWVFDNPNWDWRTFDYDRDVALADTKLASINAVSTDLSAFRTRGGKLLMYSGWADPIGPSMDAVNYYEKVANASGGRQNTEPFFRLFMVPGMAHCGLGPGPNQFGGYGPAPVSSKVSIDPEHDVLSAVVHWVETGLAPASIVASHVASDRIDRTRRLCPYPQIGRWNGSGSSDDAKNFICVEPSNGRELPSH